MTSHVRVRFAPSPTGQLHVGNVRTALFNYLFARQQHGRFVLRIEDTDLERSRREYEGRLIEDLKWFGLDWDEGPDVGGEYGPYRQSDRLKIYEEFAQRLHAAGRLYRCFCTPQELDAEREEAKKGSGSYVYSRRCRNLTSAETEVKAAGGQPSTLRFHVRPGRIQWQDIVRGPIDWDCELLGDFVIVKSDGWPVYNFAAVVDDSRMKITHVIRGDGHVSNTPRQLLLFEALGLEPPRYAHLSTILGGDGTKLSKRHGATSLSEFQEAGYLPEALFNFLSLLGWSPPDGRTEILTKERLLELFSLERVSKSPAIFDLRKLNWMNRSYLRSAPKEGILAMAAHKMQQAGRIPRNLDQPGLRAWLGDVVDAAMPYLDAMEQIVPATDVIFDYDPATARGDAEVARLLGDEQSVRVIGSLRSKFEDCSTVSLERFKRAVSEVAAETGLKGKSLFHPIRLALTLRPSGPELDKLVPIFETGSTLDLAKPIPNVKERLHQFLALAR